MSIQLTYFYGYAIKVLSSIINIGEEGYHMKLKILKKGFNYSQDGPGNRLVYHLQGCNMSCRWCANPESISSGGSLMIEKEKLLEAVCPYGAIREGGLNRHICSDCHNQPCLHEYKNQGIHLSCFEMSEDEILDEAEASSTLFFDHGGVTFSGGEPTFQYPALKQILKRLKENNIHTAIETNGTHKRLEELFPYIDMLIMDFKHINNELHKEHTGVSNEQIMVNVEKAMSSHPNVLIRTALVNGFNADRKYINEFLSFYKQFNHENTQFELLKFHEYGKEKWEQCGLTYQMESGYIREGLEKEFEEAYRAKGLTIIRT
jgi:pyruvate formate lyase activating enzyme